MTDAGEPLLGGDPAGDGASPLDDIEKDLNTADKALAALDSGDLEAAEALAAALGSPGAEPPEGSEQGGGPDS